MDDINDRIERVTRMEQVFDAVSGAFYDDPASVCEDPAVADMYRELVAYYESPQWRSDYDCDDRGELPADLKRGVLSQDGVYNLICDVEQSLHTLTSVYDDEAFFEAYAAMARSQGGLEAAGEWSTLEPMMPSFDGADVLDLGCGYGWHCKYAAQHNARSVLGIDLSVKMLEEAKRRNSDDRITYRLCGIADYEYPYDSFDVVISNLALHYVEDLNEVYRKVYRTLRDSGVFIFNIEHPVFTAGVNQKWVCDESGTPLYWPVDNYYYPGKRNTVFLGTNIVKYHHTFTGIVNGLIECGFTLEAVKEAQPDEKLLEEPGMIHEMRRPMMLLVRARKR